MALQKNKKQVIAVSLPEHLIDALDAVRKQVGVTRSEAIQRAIEMLLASEVEKPLQEEKLK